MTLLARAKLSAHLIFPSPRNRPINALQQRNFYTIKTTRNSQRTQQLTKPRTQKSFESSSSFSQRIKKQTEALTVWPRPREIPYREKVANFVSLIGHVKISVQFEASSDGKNFAATVISQEDGGEKNSMLIPVLFEGDLAHEAACHVKENDCVVVSGQLSVGPMRLLLSESLGKFHVVAKNLNFVEGLKRNALEKRKEGVLFSDVEMDKPVKPGSKNIEEVLTRVDNDHDFNQQCKHQETKTFSIVKNEWTLSVSAEDSPLLNTYSKAGGTVERQNDGETVYKDEFKPRKGKKKSGKSSGKKKDKNLQLDLWRDLVKNPLQWWDYRDHKSNGLVKENFPDFKQKETTGKGLWLNSAPEWVLPGLGRLELDVQIIKRKQDKEGEMPGDIKKKDKLEISWKNLMENPDKWWDNRTNKRNPEGPDFKHKETGEVLWLNSSPAWALSGFPPLREGQITIDGKRTTQTPCSV